MSMNIGIIEQSGIIMKEKGKLRWDKISKHDLEERYTGPLRERLGSFFSSWSTQTPVLIDEVFNQIVESIRKAEGVIPRSRLRKHQKPFWCKKLDDLKREKILRFK